MAALGSEAPDLQYLTEPEEQRGASEFELHEGRGLDRQARKGLDPFWRRCFKAFLASVVFIACLGLFRVQLTVWCVEALSANAELKSQVNEVLDTSQALAQDASKLASSERIERIATQNFGMIYAGAGESLAAQKD